MGRYVVRRLLQVIPVLVGVTFIIFCLVFALPGDPTRGGLVGFGARWQL